MRLISSILTLTLGMQRFLSGIVGVLAAESPIPWNVNLPSNVLILWSTLSAKCWTTIFFADCEILSKLSSEKAAEHRLNNWHSEYDIQKPSEWSVSRRNLDEKWWSICTATTSCSGHVRTRGRIACTIHWPMTQPSEKFAFQRTSQRGNLSECLEEILTATRYLTDHRHWCTFSCLQSIVWCHF